MAGNGPAPTPTNILKMRGSWRANKRSSEPVASGKPVCPRWLTPGAKNAWQRVVPKLQRLGVLGESDAEALTRYCVTLDWWQQLARMDLDPLTREGWRVSVMLGKLSEQLTRLEAQFGMTPSARTRVHAAPAATRPNAKDKSRFFRSA